MSGEWLPSQTRFVLEIFHLSNTVHMVFLLRFRFPLNNCSLR